MIRRIVVTVILIGVLGALPVAAQDTTGTEGPRAERLRAVIEERFSQRLVTELGLTDEQAIKTRAVLLTFGGKRRTLERDERRLKQEMAAAMRPGVAANEGAVTRLLDQILTGRVAYAQTFKDEQVELAGVLSPVQRAQYVALRDRLVHRVQDIRNQRQETGGGLGLRRNRPGG